MGAYKDSKVHIQGITSNTPVPLNPIAVRKNSQVPYIGKICCQQQYDSWEQRHKIHLE